MAAAGIDPAESRRAGTLVWLDAAATMARFITEGRIDRDAFDRVIGAVVRQARESGRPVRVFGEMVSLLWDAGHVLTAIELEELWNELRRDLPFSLLCAYHSESVRGPPRRFGVFGPGGRGLHLVAAVAVDWGIELTAEGKTVWAKLQP